jgi:hypothetical protein
MTRRSRGGWAAQIFAFEGVPKTLQFQNQGSALRP